MTHKFIQFLVLFFVILPTHAEDCQTQYLDEIEVSTSIKEERNLSELPVSSNTFNLSELDNSIAPSAKDLSSLVPNFHLPDYGSKTTSSIYVRGLGARIDQPVVGLIIDNIPVLNKSCYDIDFFDFQRVEFLRGPQGTLYGRNTPCGLINLYTLSPFTFQGTRLEIGYSTGNSVKLKVATYHKKSDKFGFSIAANADHTNGLFINSYNLEKCDPSNSLTLRSKQMWNIQSRLSLENALSIGIVRQGGYAYSLLTDNVENPINYNDECHYHRFNLLDGIVVKYEHEKFKFSSATSYQLLDDDMLLDQDFLPLSIFTLSQLQKEHAFTEEIVFLSNNRQEKVWNWKSGFFFFYKHNDLSAPVTFKKDGIDNLILSNANAGIQKVFPSDHLAFLENEFVIYSDFELPVIGTAIYHQSEFKVDNWNFTIGGRIDYENTKMTYTNYADIHYLFSLFMSDYKPLHSELKGSDETSYLEILPKASIQYNINNSCHVFLSAAKGYKAGGYNTQLFSDILQNKLKNDIMNDLDIQFDKDNSSTYDPATSTSYAPEYNWTYELGGHFTSKNRKFTSDISTFYIDCQDQQLTVFPEGKSTGRMMRNAGQSRSVGTEISVKYRQKNVSLQGSYGYTNAKFVDYNDGNKTYDGKYVPFAPINTANLVVQYTFYIHKKLLDNILLTADWKGTGKIYWNEDNDVCQPFYSLFGSSIAFQKEKFVLKAWCKNIGDTHYDTFYFKSIGNQFCQVGKPRQLGVSLKYEF